MEKDILHRKEQFFKNPAANGAKRASDWNNPDQLVEAMFALSRSHKHGRPIAAVYLTISEIDRARSGARRLTPATVRVLSDNFLLFHDQYPLFSEFSELDNSSITHFVSVATSLNRISDNELRADTLGIFQTPMWAYGKSWPGRVRSAVEA